MIVWQGLGLMAIIVPVLFAYLFDAIFFHNIVCDVVGFFLGSLFVFFWGRKLHDKNTNMVSFYDENGNEYKLRKHVDTLFWIPMEYWFFIYLGLSLLLLFQWIFIWFAQGILSLSE